MAPFAQVEHTFWESDGQYGSLPPLTQEIVDAAERELGVTLPAELLRLLRIRNGGVVAEAWNACPAEANFYSDAHVPFDVLAGIGPTDIPGGRSLLDTPYLIQEWALPEHLVLLSGDGHTWVALDYRTCGPRGNPAVIWHDNEMDHELPLAPDFRTFVELLTAADSFQTDEDE